MLSEAANISSQPLHTSDAAVWGALSVIALDDMCFQIESNAVGAHYCKNFRKRVTAEDAENPSASSMTVFLKDTTTNGTYLNWEKLKKTSSDAKLRHGDIISFADPPQHELAAAYVFREVSRFNFLDDSVRLKRKAEELVSKNKRLKGTGMGASESPISHYDLRSRQQSNMISKEPMKRLEGQVLTADSVCIENREAVAHHESDDASTQGSKADSECVVDYSTEFTTQETFKSQEALIQWAHEVGGRNGFVVVIKTSDAGERPRITFGCERSGLIETQGRARSVCTMWRARDLAAECLEEHSYAGRLSEEETSLLVDMSKSLVQRIEILVTLKQRDALNVTTTKTIYNARYRYRVAEKARTSQMQQLLGQLTVHQYIEWRRSCESTGTYEREENYAWVLGVLRSVMDDTAPPDVIVTDGEMKAIHNTCMHCGNVTINRAEGSHAKLKRQLGSSQGSFESSWRRIHNLLELQHNDIKSSFENSLIVYHNDKPIELNELWGNISISVLDRVLAETKRANFLGCDASACGCVIRRTHGLPCAHEISDYMKEGRPIPLDAIHHHWRKLDISHMALDCKLELDLVAKLFKECDLSAKVEILKKLRELIPRRLLKEKFIEPGHLSQHHILKQAIYPTDEGCGV
ncbi:hypothetical protein Vadar_021481 [Vaccinium darrowii]|uniref:Uncharacterized protein n=1 Tax=Vaccinium darrowii TaxID=229202 RepID=A0ACB7Y9G7_9ERIC|nr:hypothetical protein Vadar_021481 [Vaccinium darrowii]